jgi:hypothetical protein
MNLQVNATKFHLDGLLLIVKEARTQENTH